MTKANPPPPKADPASSLLDQASGFVSRTALGIEHSLAGFFNPASTAAPLSGASAEDDSRRERQQEQELNQGNFQDPSQGQDEDTPASNILGSQENLQANTPLQNWEHVTDPDAAPPGADPGSPADGQTGPQSHVRPGRTRPPTRAETEQAQAFAATNFGQPLPSAVLEHYGITDPVAQRNVRAYLDMIAVSEGTAGRGDNGYHVKVGGSIRSGNDFQADVVDLGHGLRSSAYGRYQIMRNTYNGTNGHPGLRDVLRRLGFTDFSPAAQDAAAIELLKERGALADIAAGRFADAVRKTNKEWASLPGAGYGQHENRYATLERAFVQAGGQDVGAPGVTYAAATPPHRTVLAAALGAPPPSPMPGGRPRQVVQHDA